MFFLSRLGLGCSRLKRRLRICKSCFWIPLGLSEAFQKIKCIFFLLILQTWKILNLWKYFYDNVLLSTLISPCAGAPYNLGVIIILFACTKVFNNSILSEFVCRRLKRPNLLYTHTCTYIATKLIYIYIWVFSPFSL